MMLIQPYQPRWATDFTEIKQCLQPALQALPVTIVHVGSTAVPGLAAKAIIDIDIVHTATVSFEAIQAGLVKIGYRHHGDQGIAAREVFKRTAAGEPHPVLDGIAHHLYVCPAHSAALRRHLLFRDYLIAHEPARLAYAQLKYAIAAAAGQDRKRYAVLKEVQAKAFIDDIIAKAAAMENSH